MLAETMDPPDLRQHYQFDVPLPAPKEAVPQYLKHLPVGASCWMEHKHLRALRMHGRKFGWKLVYRAASSIDGFVANKPVGKYGRVWRIK
jgi:hypothetical protein